MKSTRSEPRRSARIAKFVSKERLRDAVARLGESAAHQRLCDFLIVKRAIAQSPQDEVTFSTNDLIFTSAVAELASTTASPDLDSERPYVNVFGTGAHHDHGYRTAKYITNGPGVTVPRLETLVVKIRSRPSVVKLSSTYVDHLEELFLVAKRGKKPQLDDAACWYFRFTDVEARFGSGVTIEDLKGGFRQDLGLTDEEIGAIFETPEVTQPPSAS